MSMRGRLTTRRVRSPKRCGSALYVTVAGTTMIVSVLGMAALSVVRIERKQAAAITERLVARSHARSAVEWGLKVLNNNSSWRSTYSNNVETSLQSLGAGSTGTVSWKLVDTDGSITNTDVSLRLKGIGRVGSTVQVSSLAVQPGQAGPNQLRAVTSGSTTDQLVNNKWYCQYLKVTLPAEAIGWRVSGVEIYGRRLNNNRTFFVRVYDPLGTNMPSGTLIDAATGNSASFGALLAGWVTIPLGGYYWLSPSSGVCIALETAETAAPIELNYVSSGFSEADSALIRGNPSWSTYETDKSLRYRVHGYYATPAGISPIAGSWIWDAP